jgi:carboxyl-terminal processing protease
VIGNNVGYLYIDSFETNVEKEFAEKLNGLVDRGVKGLIFDVRFNNGGYVTVMKNMLDLLLPEGTVISMVDKAGDSRELKSDASAIELPMVVITNEYSISAAEFFAAALQEYGVATVVGDKTGGKGYAQTLFELKDGSSLNLSVYKYYTPKGISLVGKGVTPDIEISLSEEDFINFYSLTVEQDTQLQAAIGAVSKMIG